MAKHQRVDIPPHIRAFIRIHISTLYKKQLFKYHERDDLIQELVLFYIEKFFRSRTKVPDELVFIALKRQANHLLRSRLRTVHSGVFFTQSLNYMQEDNGIEVTDSFCLEDLERKITIAEIMNGLTPKEQKIVSLLLAGYSVNEIRDMCHLRNGLYKKLCQKIAEMVKK